MAYNLSGLFKTRILNVVNFWPSAFVQKADVGIRGTNNIFN